MPVGPITLSDEVGIDISNHVGSFMSKADLGVRMNGGDPRQTSFLHSFDSYTYIEMKICVSVCALFVFLSNRLMSMMVEKGWLGKKTGKGFYLYPKDAKKGAPKELNKEMLSMLSKFRVENGFGDKEGVYYVLRT
jgi:enoyl-CoA hydratase/long-chain 3-hydroxyacyl-CoA dehydrogenase